MWPAIMGLFRGVMASDIRRRSRGERHSEYPRCRQAAKAAPDCVPIDCDWREQTVFTAGTRCPALVLLTLTTLLGCLPNPWAMRPTPRQVLASASLRESALRTARFSIELEDSYEVPAALTQALGAQALPSERAQLSGTGQLVFPRSGHMVGNITYRGQQYDQESINANDTIYVKERSGWVVSSVGAYGWGSLVSPLVVPELLGVASSVRDRGDTTIEKARVHHYVLELDRDKLGPVLAGSLQDSPPGSIGRQMVERGNVAFEVWIDRDDQYLRKFLLKIDASIDVQALLAETAAHRPQVSPTPPPSLPPGASFTIRTDDVVTYRDFNVPMVITAPNTRPTP